MAVTFWVGLRVKKRLTVNRVDLHLMASAINKIFHELRNLRHPIRL